MIDEKEIVKDAGTELKSCPFCGAEGKYCVDFAEHRIKCSGENCNATVSVDSFKSKNPKEEAIQMWNRRVI